MLRSGISSRSGRRRLLGFGIERSHLIIVLSQGIQHGAQRIHHAGNRFRGDRDREPRSAAGNKVHAARQTRRVGKPLATRLLPFVQARHGVQPKFVDFEVEPEIQHPDHHD